MKAWFPLLVVTCAACSSARIAGGATVAPGSEPPGVALSLFGVGRCEDEGGARVPEPEARISVVRIRDGRLVLVERRPGYDSLVVDNGWDEGDVRVFQLALKRTGGVPYLREYRLPRTGSDFGRLVLVDRVTTWRDSRRGFHASYAHPSLVCDLTPYRAG
jgi:hypothetical protein